MADLKSMLKDLTTKTAKIGEVDKAAAERLAKLIQVAKAMAKTPPAKKA
jgi:hypothetical protein